MTSLAEPTTDQTPSTRPPSTRPTAAPIPGTPTSFPVLADRFVGRRYVKLVLVLGSLSAIGPLTIDAYLPALPDISRQLQATDAQAQLTITGLLIGLGLGQLVIGPLSDAVGRRRPLLLGLLGHALMSVLCALAPTITILAVTRTLQGVAGAAVAVVSMAMVRDLFVGIRAAQMLSRLTLVLGLAPILAPSLGSLLLKITEWRGIFAALALAAISLLVLAFKALPETLPVERRRPAKISSSLAAYRSLFSDKTFLAMVGVAGLMFAMLFTYISGAPFIMQELYGLTPGQFGVAFSANAFALILMTQLNPILLKRFDPVRVISGAVVLALVASTALLIITKLEVGGLLGIMIPLWFVLAAGGLSFPNAPAIALSRHGDAAGTAAAMLGSAQFLIGGAVAPLVGIFANGTAVPMATIMIATTLLACLLMIVVRRHTQGIDFANLEVHSSAH